VGVYSEQVLPRLTDLVMNTARLRAIRARVCTGLVGEVVEVGFGSGLNLPHLTAAVTRLRAVEPSMTAVQLAGPRIAAAPFAVEVVGPDGGRLPLPDGSADAALCTWTLCTVPDPVAAVGEIRRVLRPGGRLHFVEHGQAPDARVRRLQRWFRGAHRRVAGGCVLDRNPPEILRRGGLNVTHLDTYYLAGVPKPWAWTYEGVATAH